MNVLSSALTSTVSPGAAGSVAVVGGVAGGRAGTPVAGGSVVSGAVSASGPSEPQADSAAAATTATRHDDSGSAIERMIDTAWQG